jgi:hypothetical protein
VPLAALLAAVLLAAPATPTAPPRVARPVAPAPRGGEARWVTVVAHDEVRVEVDADHLGGAGPVSAWLRWTLADRAVSPTAWDLGARSTVDAVEVDCAAAASRTLASTAYAADGGVLEAASYADGGAPWRRHPAASVGGRAAAAVCRLAAER